MTWKVTADVSKFDEAATWFRSRMAVTDEVAIDASDYASGRIFTVAGVAQLDVVQQTLDSLQSAIESGATYAEWQKEIESSLTKAWGEKNSPRMKLIFRNATSQAYNAGRWRQLQNPAIRRLRPYLFFDGVNDSRQSEICKQWDGTIRPASDWDPGGPLENVHPQMHHGCRSQLRSLTELSAMKQGVSGLTDLPEISADNGFGGLPSNKAWQPEASNYASEAFNEYHAKQADLRKQTTRVSLGK